MPQESYPHLLFTPELVDSTPDIGRVLAELMDDQVHTLENEIAQKFSKTRLRRGLVMKILGSFVTEDDTRQPRSREQLSIPGFPEEAVDYCLEQLKATRILKDYGEGTYELTHDTLARHLARQRDEETANIIEIVRAVRGAFNTHKLDRKHYLGEFALVNLRKYEDLIRSAQRLNEEEWAFVKASEQDVERKQRKRQMRMLGLAAISVIMFIGVLGFSKLWYGQKTAREALEKTMGELNTQTQKNTNLIGYQEDITDALQEQKSDRTKSWQLLLGNLFQVEDTSLKNQLKTQLIKDYPISPFYNQTFNIPGGIEKVVIDPQGAFYCAIMDGNAQVLFKHKDSPHKLLLTPAGASVYKNVVDIMRVPGTEKILTLHQDGKLFLWDSLPNNLNPILIDSFPADLGPPATIVPHPGGALVAAGPRVYQVFLDGRKYPSRFILGFDRPVKHLAVNPADPNEFAAVKENNQVVNICRLDTNVVIRTYENFDYESVTYLAYAPDGKKMFAAFEGDIGILWTFKNPDIHTLFRGHNGFIADAAFSPDGQRLLTGGWDTKVILWDISGKILKEMQGHKGRINYVAFLPHDFVVSADEEGLVNSWYIGVLADTILPASNRIRAMAASPTENKVAYSIYGDTLGFLVWDLDKNETKRFQQPLRRWDHRGGISALTFSADGKAVLVGSDNNLVSLVYLNGEKEDEDYRSSRNRNMPSTDGITSLDINEQWIAIGNKQAWLKADRLGVENNHMALLRKRRDPQHTFIALRPESGVNVVKFIPGLDSLILTGCDDGNVYIWNFLRPKPAIVQVLPGHSSRISSCDVIAWDASSWYIFAGSKDNTASLWVVRKNSKTGALTYLNNEVLFEDLNGFKNTYAWHASDITDVAFSREKGTLKLLTASADGSVKLWESQKGKEGYIKEVPNLIRHFGEIRSARFSADGKYIITGGEDRSIKKWDASKQAEDRIKEIRARRPVE
ncbi:MAG: hypothetical protein H6563_07335 [Lewinellaceae bacterium]|nr:hypothetical protein [Lewinellaceae bacterium]